VTRSKQRAPLHLLLSCFVLCAAFPLPPQNRRNVCATKSLSSFAITWSVYLYTHPTLPQLATKWLKWNIEQDDSKLLVFLTPTPCPVQVFSVVRNPYDRFISSYSYLKNGGNTRSPSDLRWQVKTQKRFILWPFFPSLERTAVYVHVLCHKRQRIIVGLSFAEFIQTYFNGTPWGELPIHFQPQHVFLCNASDGSLLVDHLVRFESPEEGMWALLHLHE
jgi:hypothetical protein